MQTKTYTSGIWMPCVLMFLACCGAGEMPRFRNGDIIFQESISSQSEALRLATHSPYTHTGVIFLGGDEPVVYEAVGPVKKTPLKEWIRQGDGGRFVVKRLIDADRYLTQEGIVRLRQAGERYFGKPYDFLFGWSDESIYCSELVWKMYESAFGIRVGALRAFGDFDLTDPAVVEILERRFPEGIPLDEPVIAPVDIFMSEMLITVYER